MAFREAVKRFIGRVKSDYGYFKKGRAMETAEIRAEKVRKNKLRLKNIREGNPEENLKLDRPTY